MLGVGGEGVKNENELLCWTHRDISQDTRFVDYFSRLTTVSFRERFQRVTRRMPDVVASVHRAPAMLRGHTLLIQTGDATYTLVDSSPRVNRRRFVKLSLYHSVRLSLLFCIQYCILYSYFTIISCLPHRWSSLVGGLQALPYAFGKLGMRAKVYATLPVWKMGQMAVYDAYISRSHEVTRFK